MYFTFDDGPIPEVTPLVLDLLKKYNAKATFFCIGDNVRKHPEIYQRILHEGHSTGNHSYSHFNSWKVSSKVYMKDVEAAQPYISSTLFRPPYGKLTPITLFKLRRKFRIIMWDVISGDFDEKVPAQQVEKNVLENAVNGSVIVFHDSLKAAPRMLHVLPKVLDYFSAKGFSFHSIVE